MAPLPHPRGFRGRRWREGRAHAEAGPGCERRDSSAWHLLRLNEGRRAQGSSLRQGSFLHGPGAPPADVIVDYPDSTANPSVLLRS